MLMVTSFRSARVPGRRRFSRRFRRSVDLCAAAALFSASALYSPALYAQTAKIVGLGASGCAEFIGEIRQNPAAQRDYLAWAQGFMSGVLIRAPGGVDEALDLLPPTFPLLNQLTFLTGYCARHSSASFSDAVVALYRELRTHGAT
jgi:hypothetical protein